MARDRIEYNEKKPISGNWMMEAGETDGVRSYQGYEYQILATVWLCLDLMIVRKICSSIAVEPASGEDIAAELKVPPDSADTGLTLSLRTSKVEVQVKYRSADLWTPAKFREVIHGPKSTSKASAPGNRRRPIQLLLTDENARFVLLTNAQVNRDLRPFLAIQVGDDSNATRLPGKQPSGDSPQVAKRVAIVQGLDHEAIQARIEKALQQASVPHAETGACANRLQEEVRARLLQRRSPELSREELFNLLRAFDGLPPPNAADSFVPPSNFGEMAHRLESQHCLTIVGPPGMGKTLAAEELVRRHRAVPAPFKIVDERSGPGEVSKCLSLPGRYLFYLSDPWGHFKLSADAGRWSNAIPKLLARANSDKRFLITTRTAIQNTALSVPLPQELEATQCLLNESHYPLELRRQILERALSGASWQRDYYQQHRSHILNGLTSPYSLALFARGLSRASSAQDIRLDKLIRACNMEVIGTTVASELQELGRETIVSTIALWAALMARMDVTLKSADDLRRTIRVGGYPGDIDIRKLVLYLLHAQWISEERGKYSTHPVILEGLEKIVNSEPGQTEEVLTALLQGLAEQGRGHLVHRVQKVLAGRQLPLPGVVQQVIDSHLLSQLMESSRYDFTEALNDVADYTRSVGPVALLARALQAKTPRVGIIGMDRWDPPALSAADLESISSSTDARAFGSKFVRTALSLDAARAYDPVQLRTFFEQFEWNLAGDYLLAVEEGLQEDSIYADVAVEGALAVADPPYDRLIDAALKHFDSTVEWWKQIEEKYRQADQAEVDADYANHIAEQPQEQFAPSEGVLKAIVAIRIQKQGFDWLLRHPRLDDLREAWAESATPQTSVPELSALAHACEHSRSDFFFRAAKKSKNKHMALTVFHMMLSPGEIGSAGWSALLSLLTPDELPELLHEAKTLPLVRRIELADALANTPDFEIEDADATKDRTVNMLLSEEERLIWEATLSEQIGHLERPSENADFVCGSLRLIAESSASPMLAVRATFQLASWGENVDVYLPRFLAADDSSISQNALRLLAKSKSADSRTQLLAALANPEYRCRREAMDLLALAATETEKSSILKLARDPSAPVREKCAEIIGEYQWDDAQSVLCELLEDQRNQEGGVGLFNGHFSNFHVARAAAKALGVFTDRVHAETVKAVLSFLSKRNMDRDDPIVHFYALEFIAGVRTQAIIQKLVDYLSDEWHVGGMKHEGFPLRYVAAWGLLTHLMNDKSIADWISVEKLREAAGHYDRRLAGPCLVCLGMCASHAPSQVVLLCRTAELLPNRALLLRLSLALVGAEAPPELASIFDGHPVNLVIAAAQSETVASDTEWQKFCDANPSVREWVGSIQSSDDVNPVIRLVLHELFARKITGAFAYGDIRADELPESLPVMNLRTLTGGE